MVRKLTHEEFMKKLEIKNKHFNDMEILSEYANARVKIKVRCKVCGYEKEVTSSTLLKGYGCAMCSGMLKKTTEQFIEEMEIKNPNIKILGEYKNNYTKIKCRCKIDGYEWEALPTNLSRNQGCPICGEKRKTKSHNQFIEEMKQINPNIEVLGEYVNNNTKIKCRCKIDGHIWEARPNDLVIKESGCPKCTNRIKITTEQFIERMKEINTDIEILGEYINTMTKIKVRCRICGMEWETLPCNLLRESGCPSKHISKGEKKIKEILTNQGTEFEYQYTFDDCKDKRCLPFDFYLPNRNICIEFDGEQHYQYSKFFHKTEEDFINTQRRDTIKTQYCKDNNITLIRIPYWEFDNIEDILSQIQFQN